MSGAEALRLTRELARQEGIFCGVSGGATLAAALAVAKSAKRGSRILFMVPDTGERYLSTPLFESIEQEMDAEERQISNSTPRCRFAVPAAPPPAPPAIDEHDGSERARSFVAATIADPENPVVMFALEWCEFCWAVRKFFRDAGIPFRSVDLDSVAMQKDGFSADVRKALHALTGAPTIPQIFVSGKHLGGAMDVLSLHDQGRLMPLLTAAGINVPEKSILARSYLPKWLASRSAA